MTSPQRRPDDGPEGELPPDPWAGLAPDPPPAPPGPSAGPTGDARSTRSAVPGGEPSWHPAGREADTDATPRTRSVFGHPAVWVVLTLICALALWAAWLDTPSSPPAEPSPGTVSTAPIAPVPPSVAT